jgi:hypothetical protein
MGDMAVAIAYGTNATAQLRGTVNAFNFGGATGEVAVRWTIDNVSDGMLSSFINTIRNAYMRKLIYDVLTMIVEDLQRSLRHSHFQWQQVRL